MIYMYVLYNVCKSTKSRWIKHILVCPIGEYDLPHTDQYWNIIYIERTYTDAHEYITCEHQQMFRMVEFIIIRNAQVCMLNLYSRPE